LPPVISVITVTWNNLEGLKKTALSVNSQHQREQIEWIVVDGASTDGSQEFMKLQQKEQWICEKDKGLYDAMNKGLKAAKGGFVWFLNAGDTFHSPHTIQEVIPLLSNAQVVYGETALVTIEGKHIGLRSEITTRKLPQKLKFESMRKGMVVNHQSLVVSKLLCAPFNLSYRIAADYDWTCHILKQNPVTIKAPFVLSNFELGGLSSQRLKASWKERFAIMKHYFGLFKTLLAHFYFVIRVILFKLQN
jgi:glycosyltransferase involved in cell wall biosynthesis